MTKEEKTYVVKRINSIASEKISEIQNTQISRQLSNNEKLDLLQKRKFKILDKSKNNSTSWYEYIQFEGEPEYVDFSKVSALRNKLIKEVNNEKSRLNDEVMLGKDNNELLKLIQEFANKEFRLNG